MLLWWRGGLDWEGHKLLFHHLVAVHLRQVSELSYASVSSFEK